MQSNSGPGYRASPNHRVVVKPFHGRVVVEVRGVVLADTRAALKLEEGTYPPVYYVPRRDVRMDRLSRTTHTTDCPFKGDASYFSIEGVAEDAVWSYEMPYEEVLAIQEHLA